MTRVLLIDDDAALTTALTLALEDAGYFVVTASDGVAGFKLANQVDVIVSDVNMPNLDGFSLCRKLREQGSRLPVILLTSRDHETDETIGLELGADDYITKPFSMRVLLARIHALLRRDQLRNGVQPSTHDRLTVGALTVSPERLEVRWRGSPLITTVTEFKLVEALICRPGVVLSRDQLINHCRGDDAVVGDRLIDTYVRRLRRKFEMIDPDFQQIEAVVGAGYRWRE